jgi:hypothetical protein
MIDVPKVVDASLSGNGLGSSYSYPEKVLARSL